MNKRITCLLLAVLVFGLSMVDFTTKTYASPNKNILGTYTTEFGEWDRPRTENIKLSAKALDYTIIKSGQTFSFNSIVGDRTAERGYQESTVFVYDQKVKGIGGGVCQVSTTLYNAAVYSKMEIVERHTHKRQIYYAPADKDATVDYPKLDLKFKNNYNFDILVRAYTYQNRLTVELVKI